ncbi:putative P-type ATPase [Aspergillus rambellii]|uniref:Cation-transporting ATPase n=1 Tax=Aspergillus rambellii TaxID=308745 RepID=A0A0F8V4P1_9EURO|nr:putative P-type ATPase [Aspergillus rambellii]
MEHSSCSSAESPSPEPSAIAVARRRDSMRSSYSVVTDVEMARNEIFDGPISESIPSSVASFSHRRSSRNRKDSTAGFIHFQDDGDALEWSYRDSIDTDNDVDDLAAAEIVETNESTKFSYRSRLSQSQYRRSSIEDPLLPRRSLSVGSSAGDWKGDGRVSQEIHIASEDSSIIIAGFSTTTMGSFIYYILCTLTLGLAFLLFRWFPRWKIQLLGRPTPLRECQWVVVEDQWNQINVCEVMDQTYERPLSTIFADSHRTLYDEDNDPIVKFLRYIDYRYLRFFYHPLEDRFFLISGWKDPSWTDAKSMRVGLNAEERDSREHIFGKNLVDIQQRSMFQLLVDEAFHPFYIFQLASLILWSLDEYYYYAACIFVISVVSIGTTVIETNATMSRLKEMSLFECDIRVLRNGFWRSVTSQELVPGDVFEFSDPSLSQVPCDCILLSGDCIVNESMLTGESVPVSKTPLTDEAIDYLNLSAPSVHHNIAKHFLFNGTKVIRARRPQGVDDDDAIALAIVMRTGFLTTKGALIRSMLFPKPSGFKFYRDSFRYISVMGAIAIMGFVASFANFVRLGLSWRLIIIRALDLITIVVPPALPATLTIGTNFALSRLKRKNIFCISPQKVNVGGKLDVVCFDKTGTLTEDGLDVLGVRIMNQNQRLSDLLSDISSKPITALSAESMDDFKNYNTIIRIMATCHSLRVVDGELLGDPLDVKMFQFTGWSFEEGGGHAPDQPNAEYETIAPSVARPPGPIEHINGDGHGIPSEGVELGVLRSFEFVSHLRRASVVIRQFGDSGATIFVKVPTDFEEILGQYTHQGYRVIACAARYERRLSWMKIQKLTRADAESGLEFIGFIIFENKLKPKSAEIIAELSRASIRNIMCTGDNILTAVSVARECGMIGNEQHCFVPRFTEGHLHDSSASLCWESIEDPTFKLDPHTLMPSFDSGDIDLSVPGNAYNAYKYTLAVSGDVFRWILDFGDELVVKRMLLQSLDYCCGFCGDGANDCGALKAADVGISLSDAEASVAAPFTSRHFDVSCVPTLIREGRSSLVTSFCCFKYMSIYSAIQFSTVSFLYTSASNLGDFQFLFIDLALILPIAIFMGWTAPYPVLSRKRPTADLVSRKVLTPLLGQITICVLVQLVAYKSVQSQPWFKPPSKKLEDDNIENSENTALFLVSSFQYILASVVLSVGPPFRKSMRSNKPFLAVILVDVLFSCYMLFRPSAWVTRVMQLTYLSQPFAIWLLALALGSFIFALVAERKFFPRLARMLGRLMVLLRPGHQKQRRQYKVLLEEMRK